MPAGRPKVDLDALKGMIVELHRQGQNYDEIALQVGSTERTVRRCLAQ